MRAQTVQSVIRTAGTVLLVSVSVFGCVPTSSDGDPAPPPVVVAIPAASPVGSRPSTPGDDSPAPAALFGDAAIYDTAVALVSDAVGWVSTGSTFFRTDDMGATWTPIRPPGWSATAPTRGLVAVDADTAYVASAGLPATIAATHDGGVSWMEATIDGASIVKNPFLTFRTPQDGTATFYADEGRELRVFSTTDGGATWTGPVVVAPPPGKDSFLKIQGPDGGVLWLSNGKADNEPFDDRLLLSMDGGLTWKDRRFPVGAGAPRDDLKWVTNMRTDATGLIVMAIGLGDGSQIYESRDDGRSWGFVKAWPGRQGGDLDINLVSASEWVLLAPDLSEVWSTSDGGKTWRQTPATDRLWLDGASAASVDHLWAIHRCDDRRRSMSPGPDRHCDGTGATTVLLASTDGGRTWTPIAR